MTRLYARFARRAEEASFASLTVSVLCALVLLCVPLFFSLLKQNPHELYGRFYGFEINSLPEIKLADHVSFAEDEKGFISEMKITEQLSVFKGSDSFIIVDEFPPRQFNDFGGIGGIIISPEEIIFSHGGNVLAARTSFMPVWAFEENNFFEIFDRLALVNRYYRDFFLPAFLMLSAMCAAATVSLSVMTAALVGLGRKFTHVLSMRRRLRAFASCAWLPAVAAAAFGFAFPVFHFFVYQLALIYLAWQTQKFL